MTTDVAALLGLLDLSVLDDDVFSEESPATVMQRLYGGQVVAQSVRAAATTVDGDRTLHSLHAYFLRPGNTSSPLRYEVDRVRDSRSFSTRRVTAKQGDHVIFMLSASFAVPTRGLDHQDRTPAAVDPDRLPNFRAPVRRLTVPHGRGRLGYRSI